MHGTDTGASIPSAGRVERFCTGIISAIGTIPPALLGDSPPLQCGVLIVPVCAPANNIGGIPDTGTSMKNYNTLQL